MGECLARLGLAVFMLSVAAQSFLVNHKLAKLEQHDAQLKAQVAQLMKRFGPITSPTTTTK